MKQVASVSLCPGPYARHLWPQPSLCDQRPKPTQLMPFAALSGRSRSLWGKLLEHAACERLSESVQNAHRPFFPALSLSASFPCPLDVGVSCDYCILWVWGYFPLSDSGNETKVWDLGMFLMTQRARFGFDSQEMLWMPLRLFHP